MYTTNSRILIILSSLFHAYFVFRLGENLRLPFSQALLFPTRSIFVCIESKFLNNRNSAALLSLREQRAATQPRTKYLLPTYIVFIAQAPKKKRAKGRKNEKRSKKGSVHKNWERSLLAALYKTLDWTYSPHSEAFHKNSSVRRQNLCYVRPITNYLQRNVLNVNTRLME